MQKSNKEIYSSENSYWGEEARSGAPLLSIEKYFIESYLTDKEKSVLEAGTGSGRIAFGLEGYGFKNVTAFDFINEYIVNANKEKDRRNSNVNFIVADASDLGKIPDQSYDYTIYLQQILSFVPVSQIDAVLKENYRVLKEEGVTVLSVCNYDGRRLNKLLVLVLTLLRSLRKEDLSKYELPWLHLNKKPNWRFLNKGQATVYWFTKQDICNRLKNAGFQIEEVKTLRDFGGGKEEGMLYIVCRKQESKCMNII